VNQVLREGAEMARMGWMMGLTTILFLITMVGWTWWAWLPSNRARLEAAALLPLEGGGR
jgi:cbb3-type cytochrome oxidase subunit 3